MLRLDSVQVFVHYWWPKKDLRLGSGTCKCSLTALKAHVRGKGNTYGETNVLFTIINDFNQADLLFNFANCSVLPRQLLASWIFLLRTLTPTSAQKRGHQ